MYEIEPRPRVAISADFLPPQVAREAGRISLSVSDANCTALSKQAYRKASGSVAHRKLERELSVMLAVLALKFLIAHSLQVG